MADSSSSFTAEERLLRRVIARFRCSNCHRQHSPDNVNVMGRYDAVWIVGVDCDECHRPGMFVISLHKDSSLERVTDLTEDEQDRFLAARSVDADDVEAVRSFLKEFTGDFSQLFQVDG